MTEPTNHNLCMKVCKIIGDNEDDLEAAHRVDHAGPSLYT